jgi:hypothetical protein
METLAVITTIMVALITAVVGPIIVNWVKLRMEKKDTSAPMRDALETSTLIDTQLEQIMEELECDRIWIAQFHNGGVFYPTGRSIQKFSIFYEVTTPDAPSIKSVFQNIPVSLFSKPLALLYENGEISIDDTSTMSADLGLDSFCPNSVYKSVYLLNLTDLDNRIIGVMGIYYIGEKHKITKEEWIFIRQKIGAIGSLLSNYLNNKKN